jgi:signal transduction histidine kinase
MTMNSERVSSLNWPSLIRKIASAGVNPAMHPRMARNVIITNFASYAHACITFPYYWIFKALGATWLAHIVLPLTAFFLLIPQVNRLGWVNLSRVMVTTVLNLNVYLFTASIGMETSIQNVFFFTLVSPLMLFRITEWRSIVFCVMQPMLFWALLIWKGAWFIPQTHFEPWAMAIMSPSISLTTAGMLFTCSLLFAILDQANEARLEEAKKMADQSNQAKDRFLAVMSHEIRTPMNGIFGMMQLMMNSSPSKVQQGYLGLMKSSGDLLLSILNNILDFSKIEAGKVELESRHFNLQESVANYKTIMEKLATDKGLALTLAIAEDCPLWVIGDETRFCQVIMNLSNNAIKFTKAGSIQLRLMRAGGTDADPGILFSIKDTGIGMSPETVSRLFQAFSQGDSSTTREYGGTGLGLAISKKLAQSMDGDLSVTTTLNEGSEFHFTAIFKAVT